MSIILTITITLIITLIIILIIILTNIQVLKEEKIIAIDETAKSRIKLLEKNIIGKFDKSPLITILDNGCTTIADDTIGDYTFLKLIKNCTTPQNYNIFNYEPIYKQISVQLGDQSKCLDAVNETNIILNECLKTSQKQKFAYYPLDNGKIKSVLYSTCIGYNKDTNLLELQECNRSTNITTQLSERDSHLYLVNQ